MGKDMKLNLTNPSPFVSVEISGVMYDVRRLTLSDGLEFEKISGQKFLTDPWWGNLSGLTAFAWIVSRGQQPGVAYNQFRDTTELESMVFITDDEPEAEVADPPVEAAQDAAPVGPELVSVNAGTDGVLLF
jgi:hypothetical protein